MKSKNEEKKKKLYTLWLTIQHFTGGLYNTVYNPQ